MVEKTVAIQKPVLVVAISAAPADHLLMNRVTQYDLDMTDHFEQCCRHCGIPLVEPNGAVEVTRLGIEIRSEPRR